MSLLHSSLSLWQLLSPATGAVETTLAGMTGPTRQVEASHPILQGVRKAQTSRNNSHRSDEALLCSSKNNTPPIQLRTLWALRFQLVLQQL